MAPLISHWDNSWVQYKKGRWGGPQNDFVQLTTLKTPFMNQPEADWMDAIITEQEN